MYDLLVPIKACNFFYKGEWRLAELLIQGLIKEGDKREEWCVRVLYMYIYSICECDVCDLYDIFYR